MAKTTTKRRPKRKKAVGQRKVVRRTKTVYAMGPGEVPDVFEWQYAWSADQDRPAFVLTSDDGEYFATPRTMTLYFRPFVGSGPGEEIGTLSAGSQEVRDAVRRHMRGETTVWQRVKKALKINPSEAAMLPHPQMRKDWVRKVARKHGVPMPNPAFIDWLFDIDRPHDPDWKRFYTKQGKANRKLIALMKRLKVPYRNLGYDKKAEVFTLGVDMGFVKQRLTRGYQDEFMEAVGKARVRPVMMSPGVRAWMPDRFATANPSLRLKQVLQQVPKRSAKEKKAHQRGQAHVLSMVRRRIPIGKPIPEDANPYPFGSLEYDAWWDGVGEAIDAFSTVAPGGATGAKPLSWNARGKKKATKKSKKSLSSAQKRAILRRVTGSR